MSDFVEQMKQVYLKQQSIEVIDMVSHNVDMDNDEEYEARARAQILAGLIDPSYRVPKRARDDTALDILERFTGKEVQLLSPLYTCDGAETE